MRNENETVNQSIIRKFGKRKVRLFLIDNIWGADLANIQLICRFNKRIRFSYAWVKILTESNQKPNKTWVDKGSEF